MQTEATTTDIRDHHPLWDERDAFGRRAMLTEILAQVSHEALQGETLEAVLQGIVDCIHRRLPVSIASIILLNEERSHFVQEVWCGQFDLDLPDSLPWSVALGAAGRCARSGECQLIDDPQADPDYVAGNRQVCSEYLVPIRHRERLHGVLNLESTRRDFFTPEVCAVFNAIAEQVAGAIHAARLLGELESANRKLRELSFCDGLTGIANRRGFDERLRLELDNACRAGAQLTLLMLDVDCFKALNGIHGHPRGDECLRRIARLCEDAVQGRTALVARYGGEEIAILLPACAPAAARELAERLCQAVREQGIVHGNSPVAPHVTVSIGVGTIAGATPAMDNDLVALADRALYAAKRAGRDRVVALCAEGNNDAIRHG